MVEWSGQAGAFLDSSVIDAGVSAFREWEDRNVRNPDDAYPLSECELREVAAAVFLAMQQARSGS